MEDLCKMIIVEDEDDIRNGLTNIIDWNSLGFDIRGAYKSGEDAIQYLRNNHADVVLTDICLGGISGIELADWICKEKIDVYIMILSGHSDFKYAQRAIDYKVYKYLLKPIDISELKSSFRQLYSEIKNTSRRQEWRQNADQYCLWSMMLILLRGEYNQRNPPWLNLISIDKYDSKGWILCKLHCASLSENIENLLLCSFEAHDRFYIIPISCGSNLIVLALPKEDRDLFENACIYQNCLEKTVAEINVKSGFNLSFTHFAYYELYSELEKALFDIRNENSHVQKNSVLTAKTMNYINDLNFEQLKKEIAGYDTDSLRSIGFLLLARLESLSEGFTDSETATADSEYQRIADEQNGALISHIEEIVEKIEKHLSQNINSIIDKACLYIDSCHGRKVTLREASDHIFVSPNYLSKLFKKRKGINFNKYTLEVSLAYAQKMLMNTDAKVYDIANHLGFKDTRYFYKVFSEYTGMTPTEYRKTQCKVAVSMV